MRKFTFILFFLTLANVSYSQVSLQVFRQSGVMGDQTGAVIGWNNTKGFGVGITYQSTKTMSFEHSEDNYPFYGLAFQIPIKSCGDLSFAFTPKAGFINQYFFIVMPELTTEIKLSNRLGATVSPGIRARKSSLSLGLKFSM